MNERLIGLSQVVMEKYISQRGTGEPIDREKAIVYDFMPVILGERFMTDEVLSKMIMRPEPVSAPFMLRSDAYEKLGSIYVKKGELIPALECYRIALDAATSLSLFISRLQGNALLNTNELNHLDGPTVFEGKLIKEAKKVEDVYGQAAYATWVEGIRTDQKNWRHLNHTEFGSEKYIEACMKIGKFEEARHHAEKTKNKTLIQKINDTQPEEILDLDFLNTYIDENHPDSTMGM